jgi:hypothetical protein
MLKREYDTIEAVPVQLREHYGIDANTKKFVLLVEEPEAPPIRYRSDLATAEAKAEFIATHGQAAYLDLDAAPEGRIVDKAQLNDATRRQFIAKHGVAAFNALKDSRVR